MNPERSTAREAWAEEVRETVAKEVSGRIIRRRAGEPAEVIADSLAFADGNIKGIALMVNRAAAKFNLSGIACRSGCAACCYVRVSVLPPEALNIARHVKEKFAPDEQTALLARIHAYVESIAALPVEGRMRHVLACPFLSPQQSCTIYEVRPLACRMHHSLSREACEDRDSPVPVIEDFVEATVPVMEGIYNGCAAAGAKPGELEFAPAMETALTEEDAEARWLAGEDVFAGAIDLYLREYVAKLLNGAPGERRT
ncbi:MAG TPA: YkgJ family cysteine cluster protein [Fimbriimonadaceae bacterium]|nr:YkgJ family cysteine cluster protein [Fimbriimonadaceae bacterium]